ncbi:tRNA threonylcarbamoyladenosine biosynthesis protein TsaE [Chlamydiales bacterium SCGC AG-110-M15]|nr:tRNA threonylcarbamoyladenosine biosynthesis protein TsaE [Chlamydiales bacterium SCGC AG-110-M15]
MYKVVSSSPEETYRIGSLLGQVLPTNSIVSLRGDLAAGKTTFTKGFVAGATRNDKIDVSSPTFVYLNIYEGNKAVYHFDLYRLRDSDEFIGMGFDDAFYADGISCIEWSDRIENILPEGVITVELAHVSETERSIDIHPYQDNWELPK